MTKYLLSTGTSTHRIELYVLDLIKLYLSVYPKDIPGALNLGFDFIITNTTMDSLESEVRSKVESLISAICSRFKTSIDISIYSITIIDYKRAKIVLNMNDNLLDEIEVNLFND